MTYRLHLPQIQASVCKFFNTYLLLCCSDQGEWTSCWTAIDFILKKHCRTLFHSSRVLLIFRHVLFSQRNSFWYNCVWVGFCLNKQTWLPNLDPARTNIFFCVFFVKDLKFHCVPLVIFDQLSFLIISEKGQTKIYEVDRNRKIL